MGARGKSRDPGLVEILLNIVGYCRLVYLKDEYLFQLLV